jgi:hypothetical protein
MSTDIFLITESPVVSGLIWFVGFSVILYMARDSAHRAIRSFSHVLHNGLRLSSKALQPFEQRLALRNREVLLAAGREEKERKIDREFERVTSSVNKELADTPALYRKINEELTRLEDDYKESIEVPPSPPGWVNAVEAVAKIPSKGDPVVVDILEDIHESLVKAHNTTTDEYRATRKERHEILKDMKPVWRRVQGALEISDKNVTSLLERTTVIDRFMEEYEQILNGTDRAVRMLSSSSFIQFFISIFVLAFAVGVAMVNFHLIARPMAEMVGGNNYIGAFKVSDISALFVLLLEITMGLFLMESLRITSLFPIIGSLKDSMRVKMMWATFIILLSLAIIEAGLAYMRDLLMQDDLATSALLRDGSIAAASNDFSWITTTTQMGMGFILPFALVLVAIPLESFVHSLRTVLGVLGIVAIRSVAFSLRLLGHGFHYLGSTMIHIYDLLIFAPLWLDRLIRGKSVAPREVLAQDRRKVDPPELVKGVKEAS